MLTYEQFRHLEKQSTGKALLELSKFAKEHPSLYRTFSARSDAEEAEAQRKRNLKMYGGNF